MLVSSFCVSLFEWWKWNIFLMSEVQEIKISARLVLPALFPSSCPSFLPLCVLSSCCSFLLYTGNPYCGAPSGTKHCVRQMELRKEQVKQDPNQMKDPVRSTNYGKIRGIWWGNKRSHRRNISSVSH